MIVSLSWPHLPPLNFASLQFKVDLSLFSYGVFILWIKISMKMIGLECAIRPHLLIFNSLKSFQLY